MKCRNEFLKLDAKKNGVEVIDNKIRIEATHLFLNNRYVRSTQVCHDLNTTCLSMVCAGSVKDSKAIGPGNGIVPQHTLGGERRFSFFLDRGIGCLGITHCSYSLAAKGCLFGGCS